jgi:hypothetical protein
MLPQILCYWHILKNGSGLELERWDNHDFLLRAVERPWSQIYLMCLEPSPASMLIGIQLLLSVLLTALAQRIRFRKQRHIYANHASYRCIINYVSQLGEIIRQYW